MEPRFGNQQSPTRLQAIVNLAEDPLLIRHLVNHRKRQGEISRPLDTKPILLAPMHPDSISHARSLCTTPQHIQHLLLQIDRNHPALLAHQGQMKVSMDALIANRSPVVSEPL